MNYFLTRALFSSHFQALVRASEYNMLVRCKSHRATWLAAFLSFSIINLLLFVALRDRFIIGGASYGSKGLFFLEIPAPGSRPRKEAVSMSGAWECHLPAKLREDKHFQI